ncbi:MAG: hypothetical protein OSB09_06005 [Planctomycetota bacterium]|nr:hypothetical protein [Planctomycetota bacterium]
MKKTKLLVLASSTKHLGRCIAGREWLGGTADHPQLGEWIRPQGEETQGAILHPKFRLYRDVGGSRITRYGRPVEPGDLVEIDLEDQDSEDSQGSQDFQCENRKMKSGSWINLVRQIHLTEPLLEQMEEDPAGLWLPSRATGIKSDRVPVTQLSEHSTPRQSLFCIQPENLQFHGLDDEVRAKFRFENQDYCLKITVPDFNPGEFDQSDLANCRLVISLGTPFRPEGADEDYHFKLVAAVLCPSIVMTG